METREAAKRNIYNDEDQQSSKRRKQGPISAHFDQSVLTDRQRLYEEIERYSAPQLDLALEASLLQDCPTTSEPIETPKTFMDEVVWKNKLESLKLSKIQIQIDADCLYASVALSLFGSNNANIIRILRREVGKELSRYFEEERETLQVQHQVDDEYLQKYIQAVNTNGWPDHWQLGMLSKAFNIRFLLVTSDAHHKTPYLVDFTGQTWYNSDVHRVWLAYSPKNFYSPLVEISTTNSISTLSRRNMTQQLREQQYKFFFELVDHLIDELTYNVKYSSVLTNEVQVLPSSKLLEDAIIKARNIRQEIDVDESIKQIAVLGCSGVGKSRIINQILQNAMSYYNNRLSCNVSDKVEDTVSLPSILSSNTVTPLLFKEKSTPVQFMSYNGFVLPEGEMGSTTKVPFYIYKEQYVQLRIVFEIEEEVQRHLDELKLYLAGKKSPDTLLDEVPTCIVRALAMIGKSTDNIKELSAHDVGLDPRFKELIGVMLRVTPNTDSSFDAIQEIKKYIATYALDENHLWGLLNRVEICLPCEFLSTSTALIDLPSSSNIHTTRQIINSSHKIIWVLSHYEEDQVIQILDNTTFITDFLAGSKSILLLASYPERWIAHPEKLDLEYRYRSLKKKAVIKLLRKVVNDNFKPIHRKTIAKQFEPLLQDDIAHDESLLALGNPFQLGLVQIYEDDTSLKGITIFQQILKEMTKERDLKSAVSFLISTVIKPLKEEARQIIQDLEGPSAATIYQEQSKQKPFPRYWSQLIAKLEGWKSSADLHLQRVVKSLSLSKEDIEQITSKIESAIISRKESVDDFINTLTYDAKEIVTVFGHLAHKLSQAYDLVHEPFTFQNNQENELGYEIVNTIISTFSPCYGSPMDNTAGKKALLQMEKSTFLLSLKRQLYFLFDFKSSGRVEYEIDQLFERIQNKIFELRESENYSIQSVSEAVLQISEISAADLQSKVGKRIHDYFAAGGLLYQHLREHMKQVAEKYRNIGNSKSCITLDNCKSLQIMLSDIESLLEKRVLLDESFISKLKTSKERQDKILPVNNKSIMMITESIFKALDSSASFDVAKWGFDKEQTVSFLSRIESALKDELSLQGIQHTIKILELTWGSNTTGFQDALKCLYRISTSNFLPYFKAVGFVCTKEDQQAESPRSREGIQTSELKSYVCACGKEFGSSQLKAAHCKSCQDHKLDIKQKKIKAPQSAKAISFLHLIESGLLHSGNKIKYRHEVATVVESGITWNGNIYTKPSAWVMAVAQTKYGISEKSNISGWTHATLEDGTVLSELKEKYIKKFNL